MTDVLIIGAGASGGIAARALQDAGLSVVALEQGDWHAREAYRGSEWDWELAAGRQWSPFPQERAAAADYPLDLTQSDMGLLNFNGVGGGTILYNAIWPRLLPSSFAMRSGAGIADDWPLSFDELLPFYEETDRQIGVAALAGDPAYPPTDTEPPLPPHPLSPGFLEVARAMHARGWHWWPGPNAILSDAYRGRYPCVRRGTCSSGCNEGAKASIDQTHWREFVARGGRLETRARVRRITLDEAGRANGALWIDAEGNEHVEPARVVLCAANGVGTPRLLLASACERCPDGLANSSGLVGRRLMLHPLATVTGFFDRPLESWQGLNGSALISLEFAEDDAARSFRGGAKWSLQPMAGGPMLESFLLLARGASGADYHERFARRFGHGLSWSILCEDMPDPDNRVLLSDDIVDDAGVPAAKIVYRTSDDARACLAFNAERAADILREAGAHHVEINNPAPYNAHFMGTARMGDDPATSVVDRWGMSHDIPNLGIIDGSVFVTSGAVNPTSTICALALRAARHLIDRFAEIAGPSRAPAASPAIRLAVERRPAPVEAEPLLLPLSAERHARLLAIGDALIPPVDGMAGAGTLICDGPLLARTLRGRPDLAAPLARALDDDRPFADLATSDAAAWIAVLRVVSAAYHLDPDVRARIGYEGQVARPVRPDRYPDYIAEGLLDHLVYGSWQPRSACA